MEQVRTIRRTTVTLWCLISILVPLYFFLLYYWPNYKAYHYFKLISERINNPERGGLRFFIERQRRTVYELSQSEYMRNLILFMQGSSEVSERQVLKMESFIKAYQLYFGYKQIFLLDKKGVFVFSTVPGIQGKNINDAVYVSSPIHDSFELSSMTLVSDITHYMYDPIVRQKALFITMPVFYEGKLNGFLVVQLDAAEIEAIMAQNIDLGATGEYLISQRIKDSITFVVGPVSDPGKILPVRPEVDRYIGPPTERAALGYEGYGVTHNYGNEKVVSAWYFINQLNWGFSCSTNYQEAMFYVMLLGYLTLCLLLCALFATVLFFYYVLKKKRTIVLPPAPQDEPSSL